MPILNQPGRWNKGQRKSHPDDSLKPRPRSGILEKKKRQLHISLYLWMRQNNDPVLIYLSLVVKADNVDASLRVKGEDTISSYITSSW